MHHRLWRRPNKLHPRSESTADFLTPAALCTQQHTNASATWTRLSVIFGVCAKSVRCPGQLCKKTVLVGRSSFMGTAAADINSRCSCKGSTSSSRLQLEPFFSFANRNKCKAQRMPLRACPVPMLQRPISEGKRVIWGGKFAGVSHWLINHVNQLLSSCAPVLHAASK